MKSAVELTFRPAALDLGPNWKQFVMRVAANLGGHSDEIPGGRAFDDRYLIPDVSHRIHTPDIDQASSDKANTQSET